MKKVILFLINWYQHTFSHDHSASAKGFCKFTPSCSEYAKLSFEKHSPLKASIKSIWRIMRCNPFNTGGIDLP